MPRASKTHTALHNAAALLLTLWLPVSITPSECLLFLVFEKWMGSFEGLLCVATHTNEEVSAWYNSEKKPFCLVFATPPRGSPDQLAGRVGIQICNLAYTLVFWVMIQPRKHFITNADKPARHSWHNKAKWTNIKRLCVSTLRTKPHSCAASLFYELQFKSQCVTPPPPQSHFKYEYLRPEL